MPNESLRTRVENRRTELEAFLKKLGPENERTRKDVESALKALSRMMTGDLDNFPSAVAKDLTKWLETSKYLGKLNT